MPREVAGLLPAEEAAEDRLEAPEVAPVEEEVAPVEEEVAVEVAEGPMPFRDQLVGQAEGLAHGMPAGLGLVKGADHPGVLLVELVERMVALPQSSAARNPSQILACDRCAII
jgi:hypothetical protein